jgi:predicted  nucleic acid-binding Zn-ribbon protein
MKFIHIRLQNFCKHKSFETDLYDTTSISGCNEVGKSTIKRAIYWILNLKDENGKEITGIRPHDKDGNDIDDVVTEVELTLGNGVTLKKSYYQKRNKKGEITGNVTDCYVADIPKQSGEYAKYVSELIPSDLCVNPHSFLRMDTSKRRSLLEETFGKHTTDEIVDLYPEFEPIREMLKVGTIAELKKRCNVAIKGDENHKGLEQQLDEIPARIDEVEKQRVDIDVAELELGKKAIEEMMKINQEKQDDLSKQLEEIDKESDGILELKFQANDLVRHANEELVLKRMELENTISSYKCALSNNSDRGLSIEFEISKEQERIDCNKIELEKVRDSWKSTNNMTFDENDKFCKMCGKRLPEDEIETLVHEFEKNRKHTLDDITNIGNRLKNDIIAACDRVEKLKQSVLDMHRKEEDVKSQIADLENQLAALPQSIDISDRADIVELNKKIDEKEKAMSENNSFSEIRQNLKNEESDLQSQILEIEKQIAKSENNVAIDERIAELRKEQRELSQKIADEQRTLDYLKEFDRKKNELLEESVNSNFEYIQFKMFEPQLNGELKDICQPVVQGESYDRNLNHGSKILAEIDICRAFQRANNVTLPIITDDTESLDSWRVPEMENQIIMIRRSDDKKLKVSEVE